MCMTEGSHRTSSAQKDLQGPPHLSQGTFWDWLDCGPGAVPGALGELSLLYLLLCFLSGKACRLWGDRGEDYNTAAPDQNSSLYISSFPSPLSQPSLSVLLFILTPVIYTL